MGSLMKFVYCFIGAGVVCGAFALSAADPSNRPATVVVPFTFFTTPYYQPGYSYPGYSYRFYDQPYYNPYRVTPYMQSQNYRSYRDSPHASPDFYDTYREKLQGGAPQR